MPRVSVALVSLHIPDTSSALSLRSLQLFGLPHAFLSTVHAFMSTVHPSQQAFLVFLWCKHHVTLFSCGNGPGCFLHDCISALFSFSVLNSCSWISGFFCTCGKMSKPGLLMHDMQVVCHWSTPQACLHLFMQKGTVWALERQPSCLEHLFLQRT